MENLECLNKLLNGNPELEIGVQCKKELKLIEESIADSTLDIWCKKNIYFPKLVQREVYKCFILEFDMAFSAFIHTKVDLYHYTLKNVYLCNKINDMDKDNVNDILSSCIKIDKHTCSLFIKNTVYSKGMWHLKDNK